MKAISFAPFVALLLACSPGVSFAMPPNPEIAASVVTKFISADLSGDWELTFDTPRGEKTSLMDITQSSTTNAVAVTEKRTFNLAINGKSVSWSQVAQTKRGDITLVFKGKITSDDKMEGTMTMSSGPKAGKEYKWLAVRK